MIRTKKVTALLFLALAVMISGDLFFTTSTAHASGCITMGGRGTPSGIAPARIDVSWTSYAGADHYVVLLWSPINGTYSSIGISYLQFYSDRSGLSNGSTYRFIVEPVAVDGTVLCESNTVSITIPVGRHR